MEIEARTDFEKALIPNMVLDCQSSHRLCDLPPQGVSIIRIRLCHGHPVKAEMTINWSLFRFAAI